MQHKLWLIVFPLVMIALLFLYVWPGVRRYQYDQSEYRVDRLTGLVHKYYVGTNTWDSYRQKTSVRKAIGNALKGVKTGGKLDSYTRDKLEVRFERELGREGTPGELVDLWTEIDRLERSERR